MQWWLNVCSLYVCTFLSLAHTYFVHSYFSIWYFCYFFSIFLFQSFNFVAIASIIYYVLHMHIFFSFSWNLYQTHRKFMFFRFFIDIFPESWKKCIRRRLCVFVVSDLSVYAYIDVLFEFYLQGNRTGCHWKERLSDRLGFMFFSYFICSVSFSLLLFEISNPMIHHHPIWLITQSYCQHIQQQNRLIFHIHVVANVCCTATRSAALQHLNSWLCQYS